MNAEQLVDHMSVGFLSGASHPLSLIWGMRGNRRSRVTFVGAFCLLTLILHSPFFPRVPQFGFAVHDIGVPVCPGGLLTFPDGGMADSDAA